MLNRRNFNLLCLSSPLIPLLLTEPKLKANISNEQRKEKEYYIEPFGKVLRYEVTNNTDELIKVYIYCEHGYLIFSEGFYLITGFEKIYIKPIKQTDSIKNINIENIFKYATNSVFKIPTIENIDYDSRLVSYTNYGFRWERYDENRYQQFIENGLKWVIK